MEVLDFGASGAAARSAWNCLISPRIKKRHQTGNLALMLPAPPLKSFGIRSLQPNKIRAQNSAARSKSGTASGRGRREKIQQAPKRRLKRNWREIQGANEWEGMLDPLDIDLKSELIRYGEFAQACFDGFDRDPHSRYCGSCKYTKDTLLGAVGLPESGYEVTKFLYATSEGSPLDVFGRSDSANPWSKDVNWMGFIAVATSEKEIERIGRRDILIAWRGTVLSLEWVQNLKDYLQPTGLHHSHKNVKAESGFLNVYTSRKKQSKFCSQSARDQLLSEIRRLVEKYRGEELSITLTGHGLGGALALLSASDIAEQGLNCLRPNLSSDLSEQDRVIPVTVFSFGAPRLGNEEFKYCCTDLGVKTLRVANTKDLVPRLPGVIFNEGFKYMRKLVDRLPWTYSHVGTMLALDSSKSPYLRDTVDPSCHHNLEAYLHLIDGYQGPNLDFQSGTNRDPALVNKASNFLKDECAIPPFWWKEQHKGMIQNAEGRWVQPKREVDVDEGFLFPGFQISNGPDIIM